MLIVIAPTTVTRLTSHFPRFGPLAVLCMPLLQHTTQDNHSPEHSGHPSHRFDHAHFSFHSFLFEPHHFAHSTMAIANPVNGIADSIETTQHFEVTCIICRTWGSLGSRQDWGICCAAKFCVLHHIGCRACVCASAILIHWPLVGGREVDLVLGVALGLGIGFKSAKTNDANNARALMSYSCGESDCKVKAIASLVGTQGTRARMCLLYECVNL